MKERLETKSRELQKLKKESKRNNINSFSSDNNSYINIGCCDNRSNI